MACLFVHGGLLSLPHVGKVQLQWSIVLEVHKVVTVPQITHKIQAVQKSIFRKQECVMDIQEREMKSTKALSCHFMVFIKLRTSLTMVFHVVP